MQASVAAGRAVLQTADARRGYEVYRFLESTVRPAIEEVTAVFVEKGLNVTTQPDPSNDSVSLEIGHGEERPFVYQVQMRGYFWDSR